MLLHQHGYDWITRPRGIHNVHPRLPATVAKQQQWTATREAPSASREMSLRSMQLRGLTSPLTTSTTRRRARLGQGNTSMPRSEYTRPAGSGRPGTREAQWTCRRGRACEEQQSGEASASHRCVFMAALRTFLRRGRCIRYRLRIRQHHLVARAHRIVHLALGLLALLRDPLGLDVGLDFLEGPNAFGRD